MVLLSPSGLWHSSFPSIDTAQPSWLPGRPGQTKLRSPPKLIISSTSCRPRGISEWKHLLRWSQAPSSAGGLGNHLFSLPGCQGPGPAATSSFLRSCWCSHSGRRRGHSWGSALCWRSRRSPPTPARHSQESCLSPPSKCPICQIPNPPLTSMS